MNRVSLFLPMLSLIFVLALVILGYIYVDRKRKIINNRSGFNELGRHYFTPKNFISVIKIGDKFFSLGISENGINKISELTEEEVEKYFAKEEIKIEILNNFSEVLKKAKNIKKLKINSMRDEENEKGK